LTSRHNYGNIQLWGGGNFLYYINLDISFVEHMSGVSLKKKTYHIHQMDDNHNCFHCDATGSQKIYKSIERAYFYTIPTPIKQTTYFTKCSARGCNGETVLTRETVEFMRLSLYDSLEEST